jgi:hypothetical protein
MQFWPLPFHNVISFKALEPIGRELKTVGKVLLSPPPPPPPPLVGLLSASFAFTFWCILLQQPHAHTTDQVANVWCQDLHLGDLLICYAVCDGMNFGQFVTYCVICFLVIWLQLLDKAFELMQAPFSER